MLEKCKLHHCCSFFFLSYRQVMHSLLLVCPSYVQLWWCWNWTTWPRLMSRTQMMIPRLSISEGLYLYYWLCLRFLCLYSWWIYWYVILYSDLYLYYIAPELYVQRNTAYFTENNLHFEKSCYQLVYISNIQQLWSWHLCACATI